MFILLCILIAVLLLRKPHKELFNFGKKFKSVTKTISKPATYVNAFKSVANAAKNVASGQFLADQKACSERRGNMSKWIQDREVYRGKRRARDYEGTFKEPESILKNGVNTNTKWNNQLRNDLVSMGTLEKNNASIYSALSTENKNLTELQDSLQTIQTDNQLLK